MIFRRKKPLSFAKAQLEAWLQTVEVAATAVADVGGQKRPIINRVKSWKVERYDILDLPAYDLNKEWSLGETYDAVFCLEVFEYIYNPMQAMHNLFRILKENGVLYASFHFIYPHHDPAGKDYLRYTRWGVERLITEAGFRDMEIKPRNFQMATRILAVYRAGKMKGTKEHSGAIHREQGYLVKATK